jgi:hypothetical protein
MHAIQSYPALYSNELSAGQLNIETAFVGLFNVILTTQRSVKSKVANVEVAFPEGLRNTYE